MVQVYFWIVFLGFFPKSTMAFDFHSEDVGVYGNWPHMLRRFLGIKYKMRSPHPCPSKEVQENLCTDYVIDVFPKEIDRVIKIDQTAYHMGMSFLHADYSGVFSNDVNLPVPGTCNIEMQISSLGELVEGIRSIGDKCQNCISAINIDSHGSPGSAYKLFSSTDFSSIPGDRWQEIQTIMQENATIRYLGCNIGKGEEGQQMLEVTAQSFLGQNGGSVKAFTQFAYSTRVPVFDAANLSFSRGKIVEYNLSGGSSKGEFKEISTIWGMLK